VSGGSGNVLQAPSILDVQSPYCTLSEPIHLSKRRDIIPCSCSEQGFGPLSHVTHMNLPSKHSHLVTAQHLCCSGCLAVAPCCQPLRCASCPFQHACLMCVSCSGFSCLICVSCSGSSATFLCFLQSHNLQSILSGPKLVGSFFHPAGPHGFLDTRGQVDLPRLLLWQEVVHTEPGAPEHGPAPVPGGFAELSPVLLQHVSNLWW